jgi:hypothetical protein
LLHISTALILLKRYLNTIWRFIAENIPAEIKELNRWVTWDWVWSEKSKKWTKPPLQLNHKLASSTDSKTSPSMPEPTRKQNGSAESGSFTRRIADLKASPRR